MAPTYYIVPEGYLLFRQRNWEGKRHATGVKNLGEVVHRAIASRKKGVVVVGVVVVVVEGERQGRVVIKRDFLLLRQIA